MQEKILQEYEKVKDKLSKEEFLEEMENLKADNNGIDFIDDFGAAQMVVQNHNGVDTSIFENKVEESSNVMTEDLQERYDKISDKLSQDEFFSRMEHFRQQESHNPFMTDVSLADMVVGELVDEKKRARQGKRPSSPLSILPLDSPGSLFAIMRPGAEGMEEGCGLLVNTPYDDV